MAMERDIVDEALIKWQHVSEGEGAEGSALLENVDYLRELTKLPENYPDTLKDLFWGYNTKDIILGNLTPQDRTSLKNRMSLIVNIAYITMPDYEYTAEKFLNFTNFKHLGLNQALRGAEGFERIMETQQTRLAITENKAAASLTSPRRTGLFGRLASIFSGGSR